MFDPYLLVLISLSLAIGFITGYRYDKKRSSSPSCSEELDNNYVVGLNYLLNEQPNEAIEFFIKSMRLNSDTVESYIVLGRLYRRRGELEKAIQAHQEILANPSLTSDQVLRVQFELAHNYIKAGLFDRGESLLLDMVSSSWSGKNEIINLLLSVYEQEKEWQKAVDIVVRLHRTQAIHYQKNISYYYCEIAEVAMSKNQTVDARKLLKKAFQCDKNNVRATLLLGQLECQLKNFRQASRVLQRIYNQNPVYIPQSIPLLQQCFQDSWAVRGLSIYLGKCLRDYPSAAVLLISSNLICCQQGRSEAEHFIADQILKKPSLKGLNELLDYHIESSDGASKRHLLLLQNITNLLLEEKPVYRCRCCGYDGKELYWRCPSCQEWGGMEPIMGIEGN